MKRFHKLLALVLAVLVLNLFMCGSGLAQQRWFSQAEITKHAPVIRSLPEEKIPVEVVKGGGGGKWLWVLLGVAAIGGAAAAAGGGGGGGGGGDSTATTGTVNVSW